MQGTPGRAGGASLPDLSPSPAGTYAPPASMTLDAKGRVTAAAAGSGGVTWRRVTCPHGGNIDLPGTSADTGRVIGYAVLIATAGGARIGAAVVSCIWYDTSVDTTGDVTNLAYSVNGGTGLLNVEQVTLPGYQLEIHYFVVKEGT